MTDGDTPEAVDPKCFEQQIERCHFQRCKGRYSGADHDGVQLGHFADDGFQSGSCNVDRIEIDCMGSDALSIPSLDLARFLRIQPCRYYKVPSRMERIHDDVREY